MRKISFLLVLISLLLPIAAVQAQTGLTCQQALNNADYLHLNEDYSGALYNINFAIQLCEGDQHNSALAHREIIRSDLYPDGYKILERDTSFSSNGATIAGTLFTPDSDEAPFPDLVVVHGSGEMTRTDFMGPAELLVPLGYAVLVYDKRGVGESEGVYQGVERKCPE